MSKIVLFFFHLVLWWWSASSFVYWQYNTAHRPLIEGNLLFHELASLPRPHRKWAFLLLFVSCFHVASLLVCCHSKRPLLAVHRNFMTTFVSFWSHQVDRESCIMNMWSQRGLAVEVLMHKETFVAAAAAAASLLQFALQRTSVIAPKRWGFLIGRGPLALIWAHWQSGMNSIRSQSWCSAWNDIADCGVILICTAAEARVFLRRSLTLTFPSCLACW